MRSQRAAILMFYAPWCPFCKKAQPIIESLSKKYDCRFYAVNVDKLVTVSQDIDSLPTIQVIRKDKVVDSMTGVDEGDMRRMIGKYCKRTRRQQKRHN